jgi:glucosamine--fructose-6-phosphate aminotransferase (isomerizing)
MSLYSEIIEQPERIHSLLGSQKKTVQEIAKALRKKNISYAFLAARGTSDNAGRYANYLWGSRNRLPLALATPSLFTYYQQPPRLTGALVVGISQSGQSPDIVSVLEEGRRQGCPTLAITNEMDSPLAKASEFVLDIQAGPEVAVAATKTYTTELMIIAMLSAAMNPEGEAWKQLGQVGKWMRQALRQEATVKLAAQRYRYMRQCVVLGRGYNYATAFEWALKLKELTYVEAEPYSSADFQHGPIAMVERGFPIMVAAPKGRVLQPLLEVMAQLRKTILAELLVISNARKALSLAQVPVSIPEDIPEWLTPLVCILPAQLLAYHLTLVKGYNADQPRSIQKVTETR